MGLDINSVTNGGYMVANYERMGSYGSIHILRKWLLVNEEGNSQELVNTAYTQIFLGDSRHNYWNDLKIEKYPSFINHSDCDGGYISFKIYEIKESYNQVSWGNLDKLRTELEQMGKIRKNMPPEVQNVYDRFEKIVNKIDDDDNLASIIYFR